MARKGVGGDWRLLCYSVAFTNSFSGYTLCQSVYDLVRIHAFLFRFRSFLTQPQKAHQSHQNPPLQLLSRIRKHRQTELGSLQPRSRSSLCSRNLILPSSAFIFVAPSYLPKRYHTSPTVNPYCVTQRHSHRNTSPMAIPRLRFRIWLPA